MKNSMKKIIASALIVSSLSSCMTTEHIVGQGPQGPQTTEERQWYILWGLVPLNKVDSKTMAGDKEDYKITTQYTPLDVVLNIVTGFATVYSQTVEVQH
jgi:hypothetical protein